jgi:hypothetical protein
MLVALSVLISAAITGALLLVTRQRLARQFADIQRRLLHLEGAVATIEAKLAHSTSEQQLRRLHRGVRGLHESIAQRYGPLVPLAREMSLRGPERVRLLSEFQLATLEQWADAVSMPLERTELEKLLRMIAQAEAGEMGPLDFATTKLLASVIPLLQWRDKSLAVSLKGSSLEALAPLLPMLSPAFFRAVEVDCASGMPDVILAESWDVLVNDALAENGRVVITGGGQELPRAGFELVAAGQQVNVYRESVS